MVSDGAGVSWAGIEANPEFRVLFVRHAESEINIMPELEIPRHALPPDSGVTYPLSKKGMRQARALGDALTGERLIAIYSSTRMRCVQTATAIALAHELPVRPNDDLVEIAFIDPAASMGMIEEGEIRRVMGQWATGDIDVAAPGGGESLREVFQRFLPAARGIIAKHAGQEGTLVIVAHGGVLAAGLTQLFTNITPAFAMGHLFENADTATGRLLDGALVCTDWHGLTPE